MAEPFERLPKESIKAFEAFNTYLNLGADRSLEAVRLKLGKSKALMERWSSKYDWVDRVSAFTERMAALKQQLKEECLREMTLAEAEREKAQSESEWRGRCRALRLANEAMDRWEKYDAKCGTLEGIARLLELASTLGRRATGMDLKDDKKPAAQPVATISIEFRAAVEKIYGQPVPAKFLAAPVAIDVEVAEPPAVKALPERNAEGSDE